MAKCMFFLMQFPICSVGCWCCFCVGQHSRYKTDNDWIFCHCQPPQHRCFVYVYFSFVFCIAIWLIVILFVGGNGGRFCQCSIPQIIGCWEWLDSSCCLVVVCRQSERGTQKRADAALADWVGASNGGSFKGGGWLIFW